MIATPLTRLLQIQSPILCAPMAGIAGGALAAAVSRAGGFGLIGGGYGDRNWLEREFAQAQDERIGVGFISWSLARQPDLLDIALGHRPAAVLLSFGDVRPFAPAIARAGIPLIAQVQTVADARIAVAEGAAIVVAQGTEAGGHSGERATLPLVPAVVDAIGPVPVVAAGGIADGRGLAAALMLGASGVMCGTAFYAATESLAHPRARERAIAASGDQTIKGSLFDVLRGHDWPAPWSIRTLRNALHDRWSGHLDKLRTDPEATRRDYEAAQAGGDFDTAAVIVGEAADLIRDESPAAAILARIMAEAADRLRRAPGLLAAEPPGPP